MGGGGPHITGVNRLPSPHQVEQEVQDVWSAYGSVKQEIEDKCKADCKTARAQLLVALANAKADLARAIVDLRAAHAQKELDLKNASAKEVKRLCGNADYDVKKKLRDAHAAIESIREQAALRRAREAEFRPPTEYERQQAEQADRDRIAEENRARQAPVVEQVTPDPALRWVGYSQLHIDELPPEVAARKTVAFKQVMANFSNNIAAEGREPTNEEIAAARAAAKDAFTKCS